MPIFAPLRSWTKSVIRRQDSSCSALYIPVQPGVIRPDGETQTISVITRPAPPSALLPRCTRWKSPGTPSRAEYMSIGETITRLASSRPPSRNGWNIGGRTCGSGRRHMLASEPPVHVGHELRVAQPQVVVGDPAAAGHDVERELVRVLVGVLADVLEPLQAGLRGPLGRGDHRPPLRLVRGQRRIHTRLLMQARRQRQRVLHGQLGARADGEVRGVRRVAEQHHVPVPPRPHRTVLKLTHRELFANSWCPPSTSAHRPRIISIDAVVALPGRQPGRALRRRPEPGPPPHVLVHLQDEGAGLLAVRVAVHLHDPGRGVQDVELERVEDQVRAEPDVLARGAAPGRAGTSRRTGSG